MNGANPSTWIVELKGAYEANLGRVRGLVKAYETLVGSRQGRADVVSVDMLRAGVVLLHATVEELLRTILERRLPNAAPEALRGIRIPAGGSLKEKLTLDELTQFRGRTVDDLIAFAVSKHLETSSFNNATEFVSKLESVKLTHELNPNELSDLESLMKRRHWIAHRADRNSRRGSGQHEAQSLGKKQVNEWIQLVEKIGTVLVDQLSTPEGGTP